MQLNSPNATFLRKLGGEVDNLGKIHLTTLNQLLNAKQCPCSMSKLFMKRIHDRLVSMLLLNDL